jgi:hypothetical protein
MENFMKKHDPALKFSNPRMLCAIYFGLLSVVGTILINALLTILGIEQMVPLFEAILLGVVIASSTGALFGERIIYCARPYYSKVFFIGFFMVIVSLPVFDLGILFFVTNTNTAEYTMAKLHDLAFFYLMILGYSYILFGFFLAVGAGLAALFLRDKLVYWTLDDKA